MRVDLGRPTPASQSVDMKWLDLPIGEPCNLQCGFSLNLHLSSHTSFHRTYRFLWTSTRQSHPANKPAPTLRSKMF